MSMENITLVCSCLIVEFIEKHIEKSVRVGEFPRYKGCDP